MRQAQFEMNQRYKQYWNEYRASMGLGPTDSDDIRVDELGDNPMTAEYLIALVLEGKKTATCGLVVEYQRDNYPIPKVGDRKIFINGRREPVCVIEVTSVEIMPFSAIDAAFAYDEGEGDRSYDFWRNEHVEYFTKSLNAMGKTFHEHLPTVCERFKVLHR